MSKRFNAFIGRVEEDSYISNTEVDQDRVNDVGLRSTNDDDSEWLIGIGYRDPESQEDGFDVSVGAKLSSGLSPFAKVAHRHLFKPSDNNYWRTTQTVFWRKRDSLGFSSSLDYTRVLANLHPKKVSQLVPMSAAYETTRYQSRSSASPLPTLGLFCASGYILRPVLTLDGREKPSNKKNTKAPCDLAFN